MAQPRTPFPSSTRPRPLSADSTPFAQASRQSSMLRSILPSMVRRRLPNLPSLRSRSRSETPHENYTAMVLRRPSSVTGSTESLVTDYFGERASVKNDEDRERERHIGQSQKIVGLTEEKSGINWKFASQGLSLLSLCITESTALSQNPNSKTASPSFARQLYFHALTYQLRGLPADITVEEGLSIRSALPLGVVSPLRIEITGDERRLFNNSTPQGTKGTQPSLLHRTLATTIIQLFIFLQFVLPYIKLVLQKAYNYERKHRISEKVFASGLGTADVLGRIGMRGGEALCTSGLTLALGQVLAWVVNGVSGGIQEGFGEGMARVGVTKDMTLMRNDEL